MRNCYQENEQIYNINDLSVLRRNMEYLNMIVQFTSFQINQNQNDKL